MTIKQVFRDVGIYFAKLRIKIILEKNVCTHKEGIRMIERPRYIEKLDYKEMQKAWHQTRSDIMPIVILFTFNCFYNVST